jgi:Fic family protein
MNLQMARRPYRVEMTFSGNSSRYYLAKDVRVGDKRQKVRIYIGSHEPSQEEVEHARAVKGPELEVRAALKKAQLSASNHTSQYLELDAIRRLEEIRWLYQSARALMSTSELEAYEKDFEIHYVQGTTSIEGNTLDLAETGRLLQEGIVPEGKPLREINEVQNFKRVAAYRNEYRGKVNLAFIRTLHSHLMANIDHDQAGQFRRTVGIGIAGCDIQVAPSILIEKELENIIKGYYDSLAHGVHPFEAAILFHYRFEIIHPFVDGNGRVGREILNYMLTREKFPRLLFLGADRERYIDGLRAANTEDYGTLITTLADIVITQRRKIMEERLFELATPRRPVGQTRLFDFG